MNGQQFQLWAQIRGGEIINFGMNPQGQFYKYDSGINNWIPK
jgi:hypothetical protein